MSSVIATYLVVASLGACDSCIIIQANGGIIMRGPPMICVRNDSSHDGYMRIARDHVEISPNLNVCTDR